MFYRSETEKKLVKMGAPTDEEYTLVLTTIARVLNVGVVGRLKGSMRYPQKKLVAWAREWEKSWEDPENV